MTATEQIRVSQEVKRLLDEEQHAGESYDETLERVLTDRVEWRRQAISEGAGVWEGTDAPEAARAAKEELEAEIDPTDDATRQQFLIDYLGGVEPVVDYAKEAATEEAKATQFVLFEVYLGEVRQSGQPDFRTVRDSLNWVRPVVIEEPGVGRQAAELLAELEAAGEPLGVRDCCIAACAASVGDRFVTRDSDFDSPPLRERIDIEVV